MKRLRVGNLPKRPQTCVKKVTPTVLVQILDLVPSVLQETLGIHLCVIQMEQTKIKEQERVL